MNQARLNEIVQKVASELTGVDGLTGFVIALAGNDGSYTFAEGFGDVWSKHEVLSYTRDKIDEADGDATDKMLAATGVKYAGAPKS